MKAGKTGFFDVGGRFCRYDRPKVAFEGGICRIGRHARGRDLRVVTKDDQVWDKGARAEILRWPISQNDGFRG